MKTFEEFIKEVKKLKVSVEDYCIEYQKERQSAHHFSREDKPEKGHWIHVCWTTGGVRGGSCWDDSDPRPYDVDYPQTEELDDLWKIFEHFTPNMSVVQYHKIVRAVLKEGTCEEREYYGNCTEYGYKECNLKGLYDELVKLELL